MRECLLKLEETIDRINPFTRSTYNTYISHQGTRTYAIYTERERVNAVVVGQYHFILHINGPDNITLTRNDHPTYVFSLKSAAYWKTGSHMLNNTLLFNSEREIQTKEILSITDIIFKNTKQDAYDTSCKDVQRLCSDITITFYRNNKHEKHEIELNFEI